MAEEIFTKIDAKTVKISTAFEVNKTVDNLKWDLESLQIKLDSLEKNYIFSKKDLLQQIAQAQGRLKKADDIGVATLNVDPL